MSSLRPFVTSWARRLAAGLLAGALAAAGACSHSPPAGPAAGQPDEAVPSAPPLFQDVTADAGVQATYLNGEEEGNYAILETLGGGIALLDYDGDGRLDIYVP